ncbi:MAG: alpha/beta fold hydrolase [Chitinophagaceae bacterium]
MTNTSVNEVSSDEMQNGTLQYLIKTPQVKPVKSKAIILLHGVGSNEKDLFSLAQQLPEDFYVIAPRGQFVLGEGRFAWYQVDFSSDKPVFNKDQEMSSRKIIAAFIEEIRLKYNIEEIYLGGFSQGGIMSYSVGLTHPTEVKGIIALSGRLLEEVKPFVVAGKDLQQLKVFVAHGTQDNTLPIHYAREAKDYLKQLQVPLHYTEYNMGHQVNATEIADLKQWLNKNF